VLIVGNVYKKLKYRNSVLYEFSENMAFHVKYTKKPGENITDDADIFELEAYQQVLQRRVSQFYILMFFRPLNSKATFISTILLRAMLLAHLAPN
jgi:hypothetical protein